MSSSKHKKTLSFTGHRPDKLAGYEREPYSPLVAELADLLYERYYKQGFRKFVTGGAQGFDQLAFWSVEKMRLAHDLSDVENIVYVPFEGQERRWKETGTFSQEEHKKMTRRASRVQVIVPTASTRSEVVAAMFSRNHAMVDASDAVLALCNSRSWESDSGGTAECMRYARKMGRDLHIIGTKTGGDGALHIVAPD